MTFQFVGCFDTFSKTKIMAFWLLRYKAKNSSSKPQAQLMPELISQKHEVFSYRLIICEYFCMPKIEDNFGV